MKYQAMVLFLKYPERGKVKTRIGKILGDEFAYDLYVNLINSFIERLNKIKLDLVVVFSINNIHSYKDSLFADAVTFIRQKGENLGDRMYNAFVDIFDMGYTDCTLFGSDIPDITDEIILDSIEGLEEFNVNLGPCHDGGYYLISIRRDNLRKELFEGVNWSTDTVLKETIERLKKNNLSYKLLPELNDLDTVEDLVNYYEKNKKLDSKLIRFLSDKKGLLYEHI